MTSIDKVLEFVNTGEITEKQLHIIADPIRRFNSNCIESLANMFKKVNEGLISEEQALLIANPKKTFNEYGIKYIPEDFDNIDYTEYLRKTNNVAYNNVIDFECDIYMAYNQNYISKSLCQSLLNVADNIEMHVHNIILTNITEKKINPKHIEIIFSISNNFTPLEKLSLISTYQNVYFGNITEAQANKILAAAPYLDCRQIDLLTQTYMDSNKGELSQEIVDFTIDTKKNYNQMKSIFNSNSLIHQCKLTQEHIVILSNVNANYDECQINALIEIYGQVENNNFSEKYAQFIADENNNYDGDQMRMLYNVFSAIARGDITESQAYTIAACPDDFKGFDMEALLETFKAYNKGQINKQQMLKIADTNLYKGSQNMLSMLTTYSSLNANHITVEQSNMLLHNPNRQYDLAEVRVLLSALKAYNEHKISKKQLDILLNEDKKLPVWKMNELLQLSLKPNEQEFVR